MVAKKHNETAGLQSHFSIVSWTLESQGLNNSQIKFPAETAIDKDLCMNYGVLFSF